MGRRIIEYRRSGSREIGQNWKLRHANPSYAGDNENMNLVATAELIEGKSKRKEDRGSYFGGCTHALSICAELR